MGRITLHASRDGLGAFPEELQVVGRDDLGDVLAVDAMGQVWCFAHGTGDWRTAASLAFATRTRMHEHLAFQEHFAAPAPEEDLASLRRRKEAIEQFRKGRKDAPYSRRAADSALEDLRSQIADRRFWASKQGQSLSARQAQMAFPGNTFLSRQYPFKKSGIQHQHNQSEDDGLDISSENTTPKHQRHHAINDTTGTDMITIRLPKYPNSQAG